LYADGILTHVKRVKRIGAYTYYVGKIPGKDCVTDGELYAHCDSFRNGVKDLMFKRAKERGSEQYKELTSESVVSTEDAITMYRVITGACQAGTQAFLDELGELKQSYKVSEIIDLVKGRYGSETFRAFFEDRE
jgi:hypothetical protein